MNFQDEVARLMGMFATFPTPVPQSNDGLEPRDDGAGEPNQGERTHA